jgi:hypothetical protein
VSGIEEKTKELISNCAQWRVEDDEVVDDAFIV